MLAANEMFLANGAALSGADLTKAKGHLHDAWSNLEQVMNYGLFAFKRCFTCNPDAVIGAAPSGWPTDLPWTLQNVANQVAIVEASVQGSPTPKNYGVIADALKENWKTWVDSTDYCGHYANSVDVTSLAGKWEYGKVGGNVISTDFNLTKTGTPPGLKISGYSSPNEQTWWLVDNEIVLVHQDGTLTARLLPSGDPDYWEGPYYAQPGQRISHYIRRSQSSGSGGGGGGGGGGIGSDDCLLGQC
jgi:hypothetical protein